MVLGANHAFLLMTAFDINEVVGQPVAAFLSGLSLPEAVLQDQVAETLRRRMREAIPVTVQVRSLEGNTSYVLVLVNAEIAKPQRQQLFEDVFSDGLMKLSRMPQDETPEESLEIAAEIIRQAFDVRQVAIYQASP